MCKLNGTRLQQVTVAGEHKPQGHGTIEMAAAVVSNGVRQGGDGEAKHQGHHEDPARNPESGDFSAGKPSRFAISLQDESINWLPGKEQKAIADEGVGQHSPPPPQ